MMTCSPEELLSWYAVHTKPRQEERANENLAAWGVETLAPRLAPRGTASPTQPLFPGYIFARFAVKTMLHKLRFTRGVSYVVSLGGLPVSISEEVIETIRIRLDEKGFVANPISLKAGDLVKIQSGPLRNLVGVFEQEVPGSERVKILLNTVMYSAHVELSRFELQKLSPEACVM